MTRQDRPAPGVVHVRLTGVPADADALAAVLAGSPGVQILTGPDGPYPSRHRPGHRLYLTVRLTQPITSARTGQMEGNPMSTDPAHHSARPRSSRPRSSRPGRADPLHADPASRRVPERPDRRAEPRRAGTGGIAVTTPPPHDRELAADPGYRQAAAKDWHGRVADYYAGQQAEADQESLYLATQADRDAELDARQMDAQHQDALAENQAHGRAAEATEPEASL